MSDVIEFPASPKKPHRYQLAAEVWSEWTGLSYEDALREIEHPSLIGGRRPQAARRAAPVHTDRPPPWVAVADGRVIGRVVCRWAKHDKGWLFVPDSSIPGRRMGIKTRETPEAAVPIWAKRMAPTLVLETEWEKDQALERTTRRVEADLEKLVQARREAKGAKPEAEPPTRTAPNVAEWPEDKTWEWIERGVEADLDKLMQARLAAKGMKPKAEPPAHTADVVPLFPDGPQAPKGRAAPPGSHDHG